MNVEQYKMLRQAIEEDGLNAVLADLIQIIGDKLGYERATIILTHTLGMIETLDSREKGEG